MKRIRKNHKKKYFFLTPALVIVAVAAAGIVVTYAVSRNTSQISNDIKLADSGVSIIEDSDSGFGKKEVSFKNEGEGSAKALLRIAYSETWSTEDGLIVNNLANNANVVTKTWTSAFENDFVDGGDGWYYYKKVLNPTEEVKVITAIALNDQSYSQYNYDLSFRFESVQASAAAANAVWGKNVTVGDGGVVTWAF